MDPITLLCFIVAAVIVGLAIWWLRRENAQIDAEAANAFHSPADDPEQQAQRGGGGGGPRPVVPK